MAENFEPVMPEHFRASVPESFAWPKPNASRQEHALAASRIAPVVPGLRNEFGDVVIKPNPMAVLRDEWSFATSEPGQVRQFFPNGVTDLILLAPRHEKSESHPPRYVYDGSRIWSLPIVQRMPGATPVTGAAQSVALTAPVHRDPDLAALVADLRHKVQMRDRTLVAFQEAKERHEKAQADVAAVDSLSARRASINERRDRELGSAYRERREASVAAFDDALTTLDAQIASNADKGTAAQRALPDLARQMEVRKVRLDEAERGVSRARAVWARARQKGRRLALQDALNALSPLLAEIAALDEVMEQGGLGHLAESSLLISQLGQVFYRELLKDLQPVWIGRAGSQLAEFESAQASILAELMALSQSEDLSV